MKGAWNTGEEVDVARSAGDCENFSVTSRADVEDRFNHQRAEVGWDEDSRAGAILHPLAELRVLGGRRAVLIMT